jgi:hypothetical protein
MTALSRAAALAALLSALAVVATRPARTVMVGTVKPASSAERGPVAPCPRGTLPDAEVCIPVPVAPTASSADTRAGAPR